MEELSIEEKAKAYDEALKAAVVAHKDEDRHLKATLERIFPELKESEEEECKKWILEYLYDGLQKSDEQFKGQFNAAIAWLEKQGEQKPAFEMITPEESLGIDSDTYNKIVDECIYGDDNKKPTDKVEPKFKQGDIIKEKETGSLFYVNSVEDFGYTLHYKNCIAKGCTMDFKYEDNYELVEQTPTWSEEDETKIKSIIALLKSPALCAMDGNKGIIDENIKYLKTLKDRYTWKPSDKELGAILTVIGDERQEGSDVAKELLKVYHHLKKLKG